MEFKGSTVNTEITLENCTIHNNNSTANGNFSLSFVRLPFLGENHQNLSLSIVNSTLIYEANGGVTAAALRFMDSIFRDSVYESPTPTSPLRRLTRALPSHGTRPCGVTP